MNTPLTTETDPLLRALAAIKAVRKAFGPPGDYGYDSKEGKALFELYEAHNDLADHQDLRAWIKANVGNVDFHITAPAGVLCTNPWIATGANFEQAVKKAKDNMISATHPAAPPQQP